VVVVIMVMMMMVVVMLVVMIMVMVVMMVMVLFGIRPLLLGDKGLATRMVGMGRSRGGQAQRDDAGGQHQSFQGGCCHGFLLLFLLT
jgi:hypothetical protein